jgi:hypothetical protein
MWAAALPLSLQNIKTYCMRPAADYRQWRAAAVTAYFTACKKT